ncbi:MAG TPA: SagB family peptide dehydrogenase [Allosphingosinicella sp.]
MSEGAANATLEIRLLPSAQDPAPHILDGCGQPDAVVGALGAGVSPERLGDLLEQLGIEAAASFYCRLRQWALAGRVELHLRRGSRSLAALTLKDDALDILEEPPPAEEYELSRFAFAVSREPGLLLCCAASDRALMVDGVIGGVLLEIFSRPRSVRDAARPLSLDIPSTRLLFGLLRRAGVIVAAGEAGASLPYWSLHDRLFDRTVASQLRAASYPHLGRLHPPPVSTEPRGTETTDLEPWRDSPAGACEPTFAEVMARRRSIRSHGDVAITAAQLGAFLDRSARILRVLPPGFGGYQVSRRPYPSAGATFPIEIYVGALRCAGLGIGIYHYDALRHRLTMLPLPVNEVEQLGRTSGAMTGNASMLPQVFLVLTGRLARAVWKYGDMGYGLMLRDSGVLQQTLHLTAVAMGLASCILGAPPARFARLTGIDADEEPALGQILLGTMPGRDSP